MKLMNIGGVFHEVTVFTLAKNKLSEENKFSPFPSQCHQLGGVENLCDNLLNVLFLKRDSRPKPLCLPFFTFLATP